MSVRTVSVKLTASIAGYVSPILKAVEATDKLTASVGRLGTEVTALGGEASVGAAGLGKVATQARTVAPAVDAAQTKVKGFRGELDALGTRSSSGFNKIVASVAGVGLAMAAPAVLMAKSALTFDKTMSNVQAVSGASAAQLKQLRDAAIETGKATVFSASESADAEAELAKAGLSVTDILNGGLTGAVSLAAAGQIDMGEAATVTANALNEFQLQGTAASHIADVLAAGANTSATDVHELGYSLSQAGLVAHQTGLSLEDTVGALSAMAQAGLRGSDAGTSFKVMLQSLQAPSDKTKALMDQLGISAYNAQGQFIGITELAGQLHDKLGSLTQAQRDAALAQIFGSDAVRAANVLYTQGAAGIQQWINGVDQQGAASKVAAQNMDNLSGDVEQLKGSLETLAITGSGGVTSALRVMTQGATGFVNMLIDMPAPISETITLLGGFGGVGLVAATGFVKARQAGRDFLTELSGMGPAGEKASTVLGKIGSVAGKFGLWGTAAMVAFEGVSALIGVFQSSGPVKHDIDALTTSLKDFGDTSQITGEMLKVTGPDLGKFAQDLAAANQDAVAAVQAHQAYIDASGRAARVGGTQDMDLANAVTAAHKSQAQFNQDIAEYDTALTNLVNNGQTTEANQSFQAMNAALQGAGFSLDQVNALFPQYTAASQAAAAAQQMLANSSTVVHTSLGTMVLSMDAAITKGEKLSDVIDSLSGTNEDAAKAHIQATQALDDLAKAVEHDTKATKDNKVTLDENTQAGRDHVTALLNAVDAGKKQFQATYNQELATKGQTAALQDANDQYQKYLVKLAATLTAQGYSATQVQNLISLYGAIPDVETTTFNAPGLGTTYHQVDDYYNDVKALDGKTVMTHFAASFGPGARSPFAQRDGGVYVHAADGLLSDARIYSAVSPGRYMIAEPATGGEAFVPRFGDYARSTQIIDTASRWYGGRFVPNYAMGSGTATLAHGAITTTYNVYAAQQNMSVVDLQALTARHEAMQRVGRRQ